MEFRPIHKSQFHDLDKCETCPQIFNKLLNKRHHCRMCAKSICTNCQVKRRLSKTDPDAYPVCVNCDFELTNSHQLQLFREVVNKREELISQVQMLVEQGAKETEYLNRKREERKAELTTETKRIDMELTNDRKQVSQLEQKSNQIHEDLQIKTNNLNKLKHESAELKHEIEEKRLKISNLNRQMGRPVTTSL